MKYLTIALLGLLVSLGAHADRAHKSAIFRNFSDNKFTTMTVLPDCMSLAVQSGDPSKGRSVVMVKTQTGCIIPMHWHTYAEHLMIMSGQVKLEMKDSAASALLDSGGYALLPSKHAHHFTCVSDCTFFLTIDGTFDIHYIDANGKEISPDQALGRRR